LKGVGLKLKTVDTIADPTPCRSDPLSGSDCRGVTDDGGEIASPAHLNLEDAEAVLGIVKGDTLNGACERVDRRAPLDFLWPHWSMHLKPWRSQLRSSKLERSTSEAS